MTITPIRHRDRSTRIPAQRTTQPTSEHAANLEADIAWNLAQAVAWPEHAGWFAAEANRLRGALTDTTSLAA